MVNPDYVRSVIDSKAVIYFPPILSYFVLGFFNNYLWFFIELLVTISSFYLLIKGSEIVNGLKNKYTRTNIKKRNLHRDIQKYVEENDPHPKTTNFLLVLCSNFNLIVYVIVIFNLVNIGIKIGNLQSLMLATISIVGIMYSLFINNNLSFKTSYRR